MSFLYWFPRCRSKVQDNNHCLWASPGHRRTIGVLRNTKCTSCESRQDRNRPDPERLLVGKCRHGTHCIELGYRQVNKGLLDAESAEVW